MNDFLIFMSDYKRDGQVIKNIRYLLLSPQLPPARILQSFRRNTIIITYSLILPKDLSTLQVRLIQSDGSHKGRGKGKAFHFNSDTAPQMGFYTHALYY
jgi:hypothetical protein